jgi:hypothetical protein
VARRPRTVVPGEPERKSIWTALVLMVSLITTFAIVALFMARNHSWSDAMLSRLPAPGPATSLAADPALADQMRIVTSQAWYTRLADQTPALVAETVVINEALVPVGNVVVEASVYAGDDNLGTARVSCGKPVSPRLLGRLRREELRALGDLSPAEVRPLATGESLRCQVAFAGIRPGAEEVTFRIASVEPLPGHRAPLFHPGG